MAYIINYEQSYHFLNVLNLHHTVYCILGLNHNISPVWIVLKYQLFQEAIFGIFPSIINVGETVVCLVAKTSQLPLQPLGKSPHHVIFFVSYDATFFQSAFRITSKRCPKYHFFFEFWWLGKFCFYLVVSPIFFHLVVSHFFRVGGWTTHLKNMIVKMGASSPNGDEHKKYLKPPPRFFWLEHPTDKMQMLGSLGGFPVIPSHASLGWHANRAWMYIWCNWNCPNEVGTYDQHGSSPLAILFLMLHGPTPLPPTSSNIVFFRWKKIQTWRHSQEPNPSSRNPTPKPNV